MNEEKYINLDYAYIVMNKRASVDGQPRAFRRAAKFLLELPTANVRQNVLGKWVFDETNDMFHCSVCKGEAPRNDYPFCHWCGADMKSPADEGGGSDA